MIRRLPVSERPRERCLAHGPEVLTLRECLALILHSGPKEIGSLGLAGLLLETMAAASSDEEREAAFFNALANPSHAWLRGAESVRGLGDAGKARLLAAFEIGRRWAAHREERRRTETRLRPSVPTLAGEALEKIPFSARGASREWLGFVPLDRFGRLGPFCVVENGVRTHVNVDPGELFARILALRPEGFFLFHNHPSGELSPSPSDRELTERTARLAAQLNLRLLGHGIVSALGDQWISSGEHEFYAMHNPYETPSRRHAKHLRKLPEENRTLRLQLDPACPDAAPRADSSAPAGAGS